MAKFKVGDHIRGNGFEDCGNQKVRAIVKGFDIDKCSEKGRASDADFVAEITVEYGGGPPKELLIWPLTSKYFELDEIEHRFNKLKEEVKNGN